MLTSIWRSLRKQGNGSGARERLRRFRPCLQVLEQRVVPSTFVVNTTNDIYVPPVPAMPPANVSLRYALELLHIDSSGPTDTILLPEGAPVNGVPTVATYDIQQPLATTGTPPHTIVDALGNTLGGAFVINPSASIVNVIIEGGINPSTGQLDPASTPADTVIDAQGLDRVFDIIPASPTTILNVTFVNLTIQHGAPASLAPGNPYLNNPPGDTGAGGGVFFDDPGAAPSQNSLTFDGVVVKNNVATGSGGGIFSDNSSIMLVDSTVTNNNTQANGGGVATQNGNILLQGSSVTINGATDNGGGIYNAGDTPAARITVMADANSNPSHVDGNSADGSGGGIYDLDYAGTLTVSNSTVNNNLAGGSGAGGGIYSADAIVSIIAANINANQAGGNGGGIALVEFNGNAGNIMSISGGSTFNGNKSGANGGAIYNDNVLTFLLSGSTLNNNIAGNNGGAVDDEVSTTLQVASSTFSGNDAQDGSGGAVFIDNATNAATFTTDTFSNNDAGLNGGAIDDPVGVVFNMTGGSVTNNEADDSGGGIYLDVPSATISGVSFVGNQAAEGSGGAIEDADAPVAVIALTTLTITNSSIFTLNKAGANGGAVDTSVAQVTINGGQFGSNVAADDGGAISFTSGGVASPPVQSMSIAGAQITANSAANSGGGIYANLVNPGDSVTLTSTFVTSNNSTGSGGGIDTVFTGTVATSGGSGGTTGTGNGGTLTVSQSHITNNAASRQGGGVATTALTNTISYTTVSNNNAATGGGGISFQDNGQESTGNNPLPGQVLTVNNSTLNTNQAGGHGDGGAILATADVGSQLQVINSTLTGNFAGANGGGVAVEPAFVGESASTVADILYGTITNNSSQVGGGLFNSPKSTSPIHLGNTVASQNSCGFSNVAIFPGFFMLEQAPNGMDLFGSFDDTVTIIADAIASVGALVPTLIGHNLIGNTIGSAGIADLVNSDYTGTFSSPLNPNLNPLSASNGGPTATQAPQANSLLINNGFANLSIFSVAFTDQRGVTALASGGVVTGGTTVNLRPISFTFSMPFSNNPTIGAFQFH